MSGRPRILVGTLFCGEGDFQRSLESILSQEGVDIEHKIVSMLPEKDAHDALWRSFNTAKENGFDMMTKVDADTVLAHPRVLLETYELMRSNPRVTGVQAPLHDYFTDAPINGLNSFSPRVRFESSPSLYCDRVDSGHEVRIMANECPDSLSPAGFHCHHATPLQAFHYGLHRTLKGQWALVNRIQDLYDSRKDRIRLYVIEGAKAALVSFSDRKDYNYRDDRFMQAFQEAQRRIDGKGPAPGR